jgi:hypothetical protein
VISNLKRFQAHHLICIILSLTGMVTLMISTRWGIGLSPDSVIYISAARNLLNGNGLSVLSYSGGLIPMTHYPPLVSTLLVMMGLMGMELIDAARWLHAAALAANIMLVGLTVYFCTQSFWLSLCGSFFSMISLPVVQIHLMAWSEPLFIFFGFLAMFLLALYIKEAKGWQLFASSAASALSLLARYAGAASVATGILALLFLSNARKSKRLLDAVVLSTISCIPIILWMTRNFLVAGTATNRELIFHGLDSGHLKSAANVMSTWLFPETVPFHAKGPGLLITVALWVFVFAMAVRKNKRGTPQGLTTLPALLGIYTVCYGLVLLLSISFFDPQIPIDNRTLSPVYIAGLLLILCLSGHYLRTWVPARGIRIALVALCVVFSVSHLIQVMSWLTRSYREGLGYASRAWKQSELISHINNLSPETVVFTNGPEVVYLLTGRQAQMIPRKVNPGTREVNSDYLYEISGMKSVLKERKGVLVYFHSIPWRWYLPSESELQGEFGLSVRIRKQDGRVYQ